MREKKIVISGPLPMSRERVTRLVSVANTFSAHVMLEGEDLVISGKSMLGLLSINWRTGRSFTLTARGEDEAEALACIAAMLTEDTPTDAKKVKE